MTNAKHTPGPWKMFSNRHNPTNGMQKVVHIFGAAGGGSLFQHYYQINDNNASYENFDEVDANARLIAAAPEILEGLEVADRLLDSFVKAAKAGDVAEVSMGAFREMATIKERIAKATGGQ